MSDNDLLAKQKFFNYLTSKEDFYHIKDNFDLSYSSIDEQRRIMYNDEITCANKVVQS